MNTQTIQPLACDYDNDGVRITAPGKFEGEPVFAPYFWNLGLEGFADDDDGRTYSFTLKAGDEAFSHWPQLKAWLGRKRTLRLVESEQGFVRCFDPMKNHHLLLTGDLLLLKSERRETYGLQSPIVRFVRFVDRAGYRVPWLLCLDSTESHGHFKPSDFKGKA